jgi:hypothetical protein
MKTCYSVPGVVAASLLLGACATEPMGPMVSVMPGPGKPFDVFQQDDAVCRQFASAQVRGQAQVANNQAVGGALLGTALGAGLGAAIGGGQGAGIGAASGALAGSAFGANSSTAAQGGIQRQYDIAYAQCMHARGNQVPGAGPPQAFNQPRGQPPGWGQPQGGPPPGWGQPQGGPPPGY